MQDISWETEKLLIEKYSGKKTDGFFADRKRLLSGEPLAYLIGTIPFLDTTIHLDSHPLIPRAETEYWVEKAIDVIKGSSVRTPHILDLCAGSGCIGVATLTTLPNVTVDFVEINTRHHPTIEKNISENRISHSRTRILDGNLFECVHDTYDFILTNPPYIDPKNDQSDKSVRVHEPHDALYGGVDGLEHVKVILASAPAHLCAGGALFLEHEPEQTTAITTAAHISGFITKTCVDQYGVDRYTQCVSP